MKGGKPRGIMALKPRIDGLAFTFPVSQEYHKPLLATLFGYAKDLDYTSLKYGPPPPGMKSGYAANIHFIADSKTSVLVQAGPKKGNTIFLRIEMNPDKLGPKWHARFRAIWSDHVAPHIHLSELMNASRVTRVDVAIDFLGLSPDELL